MAAAMASLVTAMPVINKSVSMRSSSYFNGGVRLNMAAPRVSRSARTFVVRAAEDVKTETEAKTAFTGPEKYGEMKADTTAYVAKSETSEDEKGAESEVEELSEEDIANRSLAGTVIAGAAFAVSILWGIVNGIAGVNRKIAIGMKNYTKHTLDSEKVKVYFQSGTEVSVLPREIPSEMVGLYAARKTRGAARGTVGVFSYYIKAVNKTVHVMWSVPFDYNLYSNWWNVDVVNGLEVASRHVYSRMYAGDHGAPYPHKPNTWVRTRINGFNLLGNMTNNGEAVLEVEISD